MKVVVDTNVIAYYLLATAPFATECSKLIEVATTLLAPAIWEPELANVLWVSIRAGVLSAEDGASQLQFAGRLGIESVPCSSLCQAALARSVSAGIAVYDSLFVELAVRESCRLATFDKALLKAFPRIAGRPRTLV